ncbi:MAG TPA: recombination protein RecO [Campylobacterales bacterium]|nr:recombination protein RecO [Campylobacterales bacterium]
MKGFILNIRKAKNEDVIVTVLSNSKVESYWRFFGARHSILQVGNLVDFKIMESKNNFMPSMRSLSHLRFPWIFSAQHLLIWQNFIKLFEPHLKDTIEIEPFYFELLLEIARKWDKQNPKRLAVEAYLKILDYEGRLYNNGFCYICEEPLDDKLGLMRAYIPAHPACIYAHSYDRKRIFRLFNSKSTIYLEDYIINELYILLLKGL